MLRYQGYCCCCLFSFSRIDTTFYFVSILFCFVLSSSRLLLHLSGCAHFLAPCNLFFYLIDGRKAHLVPIRNMGDWHSRIESGSGRTERRIGVITELALLYFFLFLPFLMFSLVFALSEQCDGGKLLLRFPFICL